MNLRRAKVNKKDFIRFDGWTLKDLVSKYGEEAIIYDEGDGYEESYWIYWDEVESDESWKYRLLQVILWGGNNNQRNKALKLYQKNFPQDELKEI